MAPAMRFTFGTISRDIGISAQLPDGHQLWLFGDTGIWQRDSSGKWHQGRFIPGSTAMLAKGARGQVPSGGELPSGTPAIFLPTPHNVYLPDGSGKPCPELSGPVPKTRPS